MGCEDGQDESKDCRTRSRSLAFCDKEDIMRNLFRLLDDIETRLLDMNILVAMKLVHDTTLTPDERNRIQDFLNLVTEDEDGSD